MKCSKCGTEFQDDFCPNCAEPAPGGVPEKRKKKMKWPIIIAVILVVGIFGALGSRTDDIPSPKALESQNVYHPRPLRVRPTASSASSSCEGQENTESSPSSIPVSAETTGQKNALRSAKSYLSIMPFSYEGLIHQLEFEKYTYEDAVYAADNCDANWYEQAAAKAKNYLDIMSFSRDQLIRQLEYEGFTHEQAVYGAEANGY